MGHQLVFASHNQHKIDEVRSIIGPDFILSGLDDIGCHTEIPEPFKTLEDNALAKARFVARHYGCDCFADDTGLEVESLGGMPGVFSARYAGKVRDSQANIRKLLKELSVYRNRKARFRTVIALVLENREYLFEGAVHGMITESIKGTSGFGYDPIFIPEGHNKTFAEMEMAEKNRISHRRMALSELSAFLQKTTLSSR